MSIVVRAFPLRRPVAELRELATSLSGDRSVDTNQFYKRYGVAYESWHVQETPSGPWVIALTLVENPSEAAPRYASASEEFDTWFKTQILHLSGVDPNVTPLGPPTTQIFSWSDTARLNTELLGQYNG